MNKKRNIVAGILFCAILSSAMVSVYAIDNILKVKNVFQTASENSVDIAEVDTGDDFKYTKFDTAKLLSSNANLTDTKVFTDVYTDPKVNIYNKMLNTIDYINNIELEMETSMLGDEITSVAYQVNVDAGLSYQSVREGKTVISETYSEADSMIYVDNTARSYTGDYLPTYTRADTPYIDLSKRIVTGEDGIPCYYYRKNVTNCPLASYTMVPQEITFSYLKDFDKWEIADDSVEYLNRDCIKIAGTPSAYIAAKHNIDSFEMIVDSDTGILMKFLGTLNGEVSNYIIVTECTFNSRAMVKQFDIANYSNYTENTRFSVN